MRIKIIGENNCARATRHLLRLAGFAVTEFLPVDAIVSGPHAGYAITIDAAPPATASIAHPASQDPSPAAHPPDARFRPPDSVADFGGTHLRPDSPTHHHASAREEAPRAHRGTSSPTSSGTGFRPSGSATNAGSVSAGEGQFNESAGATPGSRHADRLKPVPLKASIHFDSVESELEAAVLRHVTQLAAAPVIVDRPGGVVHSDRELRIIVPNAGDAKADEAAAVAVEFGVLRGLLDLTSPTRPGMKKSGGRAQAVMNQPVADTPAAPAGSRSEGAKKKWWLFGIALLAALCSVASSSTGFSLWGSTRAGKGAGTGGEVPQAEFLSNADRRLPGAVQLHTVLWRSQPSVETAGNLGGTVVTLRLAKAALPDLVETHRLKPVLPKAVLLAEPAQGQFATGQGFKITDGSNFLAIDPCKAQAKSYASINQTANAQLVTGAASKKVYLCSIHVVVAAATNVAVVEGTGTACATGTSGVGGFGGATAATGWNFAANGGIALGNGDSSLGAEVTSGDNLCIFNSGSGQVSGGISYVVQ